MIRSRHKGYTGMYRADDPHEVVKLAALLAPQQRAKADASSNPANEVEVPPNRGANYGMVPTMARREWEGIQQKTSKQGKDTA